MRVAKLMEPYRFELLDQPIPEPGPDEVLLKNIYLAENPICFARGCSA